MDKILTLLASIAAELTDAHEGLEAGRDHDPDDCSTCAILREAETVVKAAGMDCDFTVAAFGQCEEVMPKFKVLILRTDYAAHDFIVEAQDAVQAENLALAQAGDHEWKRGNAEYEIDGDIEEVK